MVVTSNESRTELLGGGGNIRRRDKERSIESCNAEISYIFVIMTILCYRIHQFVICLRIFYKFFYITKLKQHLTTINEKGLNASDEITIYLILLCKFT